MPHELSAARRLAPVDHETDRRQTALSLTCLTVPWLLLASTDIFHEDVRGWIAAMLPKVDADVDAGAGVA